MDESQNFASQPPQSKSSKKKVILLILLATVILAVLVGGVYAYQQSKINDTQAKLDKITSEVNQLKEAKRQEVAEDTPQQAATETRTSLGTFSFVAPGTWQSVTKANLANSALAAYSFKVGSNVSASGVQITNGKIALYNLSSIDIDKGADTLQQYNASTKTWQSVKKQALSNFNGKIVADYFGDGADGSYSLVADYYLVKGNQVIAVQVSEAGKSNAGSDQYSFSSTNSKSNVFQEEVTFLLNSVR